MCSGRLVLGFKKSYGILNILMNWNFKIPLFDYARIISSCRKKVGPSPIFKTLKLWSHKVRLIINSEVSAKKSNQRGMLICREIILLVTPSTGQSSVLTAVGWYLLKIELVVNNIKPNKTVQWQKLPRNQSARAETTCTKSISIKSLCHDAAH